MQQLPGNQLPHETANQKGMISKTPSSLQSKRKTERKIKRKIFHQAVSALVLAGMVSSGSGFLFMQSSFAATIAVWNPTSPEVKLTAQISKKPDRNSDRPNRASAAVVNVVRQDVVRRTGIAPGQIKVVDIKPVTWSDSCLGLGKSDELCAQVLVEGWRIALSNDRQIWIYRTDSQARVFRLEKTTAASVMGLPEPIMNSVLENATQRLGVETSVLQIAQADRRNWSNGCLGLLEPDVLCTQVLVAGWQVVVEAPQQRLVYRTNDTGSLVKLDPTASRITRSDTLKAIQLSKQELPPPLSSNVLFRVISTGGIAGRTYETFLMRDGKVIQVQVSTNGRASQPKIHQLSSQQLQQFQQLIQELQLERFDRLSYPAPKGSADFMTVILSSRLGTVQYADLVQDQLPEPLQKLIQHWNQIANFT